jgi:casein kinase II subunit beta
MSSSSQIAESWISSFCNLVGHEYFAEVAEDFIEDDFNLTGLQSQVPMYKEALEMILDVEPEDDDEDEEEDDDDDDEDDMLGDDRGYRRSTADRRHLRTLSDASVIESSAELLYGLIHQRYITSRPGMQMMLEKYDLTHFGHCPRVLCHGAKVLPVGTSDTPGEDTVKLFCPSCLDVYTPPNSRFQQIDGAFFGTTFGYLFFMTFPDVDMGQVKDSAADLSLSSPIAINSPEAVVAAAAAAAPSSSAAALPAVVPAANSQKPVPPQPLSINGVSPITFATGLGPGRTGDVYEPRIYGFRVSERSRTGPRMQWLRMKPADITELDEVLLYRDEELNAGSEFEEDAANDMADRQMRDVDEMSMNIKPDKRKKGNLNGEANNSIDTNGLGDIR